MKDSVPLYHQLKTQLLEAIQNGVWKPGEMLPSEPELARHFSVSRTTVRQAIGDLVSSGYVIRRQGKGTFVAKRFQTQTASTLYGFAEELRNRGLMVGVKVESIEAGPCPSELCEVLNCTTATTLVTIVRTAHVDGVCFFHETSHLIAPFRLNTDELTRKPETFDYIYGFFERNGIKIALGRQVIGAELATENDVQVFGIEALQPMLVMKRITYDQSGAPVEYSIVRYPSHLYEFEVNLTRHGEHQR